MVEGGSRYNEAPNESLCTTATGETAVLQAGEIRATGNACTLCGEL